MARFKTPFRIYPRTLKNGTKVWYYTTYDEHNKRHSLSTGHIDKKNAYQYCTNLWRRDELISTKVLTLSKYAERFFTETCEYVKRKETFTGKPLSAKYINDSRTRLDKIVALIGNIKLDEITPVKIEKAMNMLGQTLSAKSVNDITGILQIVLNEAIRDEHIKENPCSKITRMRKNTKERGVLDLMEAQALFKLDWKKPQAKTFNKLAMLTGMRMGEIRALHKEDVFPNHIKVHRAYTEEDGIKNTTKTGKNRIVPISYEIYIELQSIASNTLIFHSEYSHNGVVRNNTMVDALYEMLEVIGIDEIERKKRNITFHSWRHFFNTFCRTSGIPDAKVQAVTGHSTQAMTDHYTHFNEHDFSEVIEAQKKLMG